MLGEMLQWKNFHDDPTKPPFPWDAEAARWSREYRKKNPNAFPLDNRELLRPERVKFGSAEPVKKAKVEVKLKPVEPAPIPEAVNLKTADPVKKNSSGLVKLKPLDLLKKKPKIRLK
jgi:hypothetical protein